jgi:WXG100 family type VII secretion target
MAENLIVSTEEMQSTLNTFNTQKGAQTSAYESMKSTIAGLSGSWLGEASQSFQNQFQTYYSNISQSEAKMADAVDELGKSATCSWAPRSNRLNPAPAPWTLGKAPSPDSQAMACFLCYTPGSRKARFPRRIAFITNPNEQVCIKRRLEGVGFCAYSIQSGRVYQSGQRAEKRGVRVGKLRLQHTGASSGPSGISGRLSSCRTQLRAAASSASRLAGSAMKAANLLIECEEGLEGIAQAACSDTTRSAISEGVAFALGLYKKTGILGSTIGSIAAFSMNPTAENAVKALERSIKTYVKWEENGISSDELFGLQKYLANPSQAKNIVLATSRNLNKNLVKELDLGSVANGIGFAASLAFSGIENYEECKNNDISVDRAVVETVAEGVTSFAITGVVTAAIAMAVGGPAIAVGVTSYATIFAANALYKGVTGNETVPLRILGILLEMDTILPRW